MLEITGLCKTFAAGTPDAHQVFKDLALHFDKGEFVTLIGGNGAGKSTLFNLIAGSELPDGGCIRLDGEAITYQPEHRRAKHIGRIFQDPRAGTAPDMTVEENLAVAYLRGAGGHLLRRPSKQDKTRLRERVAGLQMGLEDRMHTRMGLLSGGQRQAVALVMATLAAPKLLLLDEHTAALDPVSARRVMELTTDTVAGGGLTAIMITHNMAAALKTGTRTILLDNGAVAMDLREPQRSGMSVQDVVDAFAKGQNKALDNDRMLLEGSG